MRHFLSPAEQALLDGLPENERDVVRGLFDELDARLVEDDPLHWMKQTKPPADAWWTKEAAA